MSNDPWHEIKPPESTATINSIRVNPDFRWNFFWARDIDRKCMLVLNCTDEVACKQKLPRLKEIEVRVFNSSDTQSAALIFRLIDSAHRDIFYRLCLDIMEGASTASTEREAFDISIRRTWRWHHLLRGGQEGRLSYEEQKGLIGELIVLEKYLLPYLSARDSLLSWQGPFGATKDFEIGRLCIEAKARKGSATPYVSISSEHQLDTSGIDILFLFVVDLDRAVEEAEAGESLTQIAKRIRNLVEAADEDALDLFEERLQAAGFQWHHNYSPDLWIEGRKRLYKLTELFPSVRATDLRTGVSDVHYSIALLECEKFIVPFENLTSLLSGENDAD